MTPRPMFPLDENQWKEIWEHIEVKAAASRAAGDISGAELLEESVELSKKRYYDANK